MGTRLREIAHAVRGSGITQPGTRRFSRGLWYVSNSKVGFMRILHPLFCQVVPGGVVITETSEANVGLIKPSDEIQAQERTTGPCHGFVSKIQRGVNLFELLAKHQPGVAGCGGLQQGRNFIST